jgi:predicted small lipoprotein YifL
MAGWARYPLWLLIVLLGAGQLLSACGHKGPLYLPKAGEAQTQANGDRSKSPAEARP